MAVTASTNSGQMTAAGDLYIHSSGKPIRVVKIIIVKQTAGTVTLKDASDTVVMVPQVGNGNMAQFEFGGDGWLVNGIEYDAVSAGSAVVYVFHRPVEVQR